MLKRRKILVTTGTRAEYGILRPVLKKIHESKKLDLLLVVTGTHNSKKYGMTINEIKKDGFKIYKILRILPKSDTSYSITYSLAETITAFSKIFKKSKPDINVIIGDRDEMLGSAIAAYHMNIPNAHIHGGDRSGGLDEYNRHAITKMSNIHFAATKESLSRILKLGENPKYVFQTGSTSVDEIKNKRITKKRDLEKSFDLKFYVYIINWNIIKKYYCYYGIFVYERKTFNSSRKYIYSNLDLEGINNSVKTGKYIHQLVNSKRFSEFIARQIWWGKGN